MKKIMALALLLGLGMMVGCGDDAKKPPAVAPHEHEHHG